MVNSSPHDVPSSDDEYDLIDSPPLTDDDKRVSLDNLPNEPEVEEQHEEQQEDNLGGTLVAEESSPSLDLQSQSDLLEELKRKELICKEKIVTDYEQNQRLMEEKKIFGEVICDLHKKIVEAERSHKDELMMKNQELGNTKTALTMFTTQNEQLAQRLDEEKEKNNEAHLELDRLGKENRVYREQLKQMRDNINSLVGTEAESIPATTVANLSTGAVESPEHTGVAPEGDKDLRQVTLVKGSNGYFGFRRFGACVFQVNRGSPAEINGMRPGDEIVSVDSVEVEGKDLSGMLKKARAKDSTTILLRYNPQTLRKAEKIRTGFLFMLAGPLLVLAGNLLFMLAGGLLAVVGLLYLIL